MKRTRRHFALGFACFVGAAGAVAQAVDVTRWTPPAISTDQYEASPTFSPDGRLMMFFRGDPSFSRYRLFESHCVDGNWSAASEPPFAAPPAVDEADPAFSADGRRLYFISTRGDSRPRGEADFDIWVVDRRSGGWGKPVKLPEPVNSPASELLPRPQRNGSLYFGSDRTGGLGGNDIYVARPARGGWRIENAGVAVNTKFNEYEADVSLDGQRLVVVADRGDRSHLYPYRRVAGAWVAQPRIVPRLDVFQVGPLFSPDGRQLLFAQADAERSGELFLLDLEPRPAQRSTTPESSSRRWPPDCR